MKNIQVVDGALNCVYDIFQASDDDFAQISGNESDIAFGEDFQGETISCRCLSAFGAAGFPRFRLRAYTECTLSASNTRRRTTRRDATKRLLIQTARGSAEALSTLSRGATPQLQVPLVGNTNKIGRVNLD
jgi:hypothetical protein